MPETHTSPTAYVRPAGHMLAEQAPPASAEGLGTWVRRHLFGNVTDSLLTIVLALLIFWFAWSSVSYLFVRANWSGVTQGEGTMASVVADLDDQIALARAMETDYEGNANDLVAEVESEMRVLARLISVWDMEGAKTETRLGLTRRLLPEAIQTRFDFAKAKVPLSRAVELEILQRELTNPQITEIPALTALTLSDGEKAGLRAASAPWTRASEAQKQAYGEAWTTLKRSIGATETLDGAAGKTFVPIETIRGQIDATLTNLSIDGAKVDAAQLFERPTKLAREFNKAVDGVMGVLITNIPVSRIQKIRKDFVGAEGVKQIKTALATELVRQESPDLTGLRLSRAVTAAEETLTDAQIFLNEEMPLGLEDPLPSALKNALAEVDFWSVAALAADPRAVLGEMENQEGEGQTAARANATRNPQSATSSDGLTTVAKAPLAAAVWAQLDGPQGAYSQAIDQMLDAYVASDLTGMEAALDQVTPIITWGNNRNGANWAVLRNFETGQDNNWNRMLIGTYTANKVWHLLDPTADGWRLNDKVWRIWIVAFGLILAVLPLFVPAARRRALLIFSLSYPLLLLFVLSGVAVRFSGFDGPDGAGFFAWLFSDLGKLILAFVALAYIFVAWFIRRYTALGTTAGPALLVSQGISVGVIILCLWGNVINPAAFKKDLLINANFVGLLTADHPLSQAVDPATIEAEIERLKAASQAEGLSDAEAASLREQAFALGPQRTAAVSAQRELQNIVDIGQGTFVILPHVPSVQWGGLLITMILGLVGMAASLPIGIILAFGRQSTLPIIRWFSTGFIEVIRGVPLVALLLITIFVLPKLLPAGTAYPPLMLVLIAICLFGGVYQAEVVRGGLQSLPKGQYEAAQAMGLTFWQESRLIALPQALKAVIPAIVNTFIGLFKDTTLVIVVSLFDLLTIVQYQITAQQEWNNTKPEALIVVALIFFVLMFSLSRYSIWLEKRLATSHR